MSSIKTLKRANEISLSDITVFMHQLSEAGLLASDLKGLRKDRNLKDKCFSITEVMKTGDLDTAQFFQKLRPGIGMSFLPTDWSRYLGVSIDTRTHQLAKLIFPWDIIDLEGLDEYILFWVPSEIPLEWTNATQAQLPFTLRNLLHCGRALNWRIIQDKKAEIKLCTPPKGKSNYGRMRNAFLDEDLGGWHLVRALSSSSENVKSRPLSNKRLALRGWARPATVGEFVLGMWLYMLAKYPQRAFPIKKKGKNHILNYRLCMPTMVPQKGIPKTLIPVVGLDWVKAHENTHLAVEVDIWPVNSPKTMSCILSRAWMYKEDLYGDSWRFNNIRRRQ